MANYIKTFFEDEAKTNAIFPRTKFNAVSDTNGNTLQNVATYEAVDVSEVGEVNAIAGYQTEGDSVKLKNLNGNVVYPQAILNGIDTSNVIASGITNSYTAVQDCYAWFNFGSGNNGLLLNGTRIPYIGNTSLAGVIQLKKGQTISLERQEQYAYIIIYGIRR